MGLQFRVEITACHLVFFHEVEKIFSGIGHWSGDMGAWVRPSGLASISPGCGCLPGFPYLLAHFSCIMGLAPHVGGSPNQR